MEQEKASLRCNNDTDLIRNFQTTAAFKTLFGKENLDVAEKLGLISARKSVKKCNVTLDRGEPIIWKRRGPQAVSAAFL
jgi:hypothetical protein